MLLRRFSLTRLPWSNGLSLVFASAIFAFAAGLFWTAAPARAAECDDAFTTSCMNNYGQLQTASCDSTGRKYVYDGGGSGPLSSGPIMHCGGPTGSYCCALNDSERCDKMSGYGTGEFDIQCLPADTCGKVDSCMLGGKAYTTYDGKSCPSSAVCCQKLTDALRKDGCVSAPATGGTAAAPKPYDEKPCDAIGGLCGMSCGSSEIASASVTCGEKDGTAYACCLDKSTCSEAGGYCSTDCPTDAPASTSDTSCVTSAAAKVCCMPAKPAASSSASADAAKAGAGGSGAVTAASSTFGTLTSPSTGNYHPPVKSGTTVATLIANIIMKLLPLIGAMMLLMFFYGGFLWMTAAGDSKQVSKAQSVLTSAFIGMLIIAGAFAIASNVVRIIGASLG